jgi:geranylgeranyl reductase family protein
MKIAIVGAGPAGAMAAIRLARAGASVSIFDPSHPREKPCGGGLTGRALALIADVMDVTTLPAVVVKSAIVEDPCTVPDAADSGVASGFSRTSSATIDLIDRGCGPGSSLVVLSRAIFDRALLDAAVACGAELVTEKVIHVERLRGAMTLRTPAREQSVDFLIGADGANSLVRKKLATPFLRSEMSIAAGYFVHHAHASAITIRSTTQQPGYLWSFPRPDHLAVGICTPAGGASTSTDLRVQSREWIASHRLDHRTRLAPYVWPIPSVGFTRVDQVRAAGPGWMLLGDAAGLVDPLTREGIYYALLSGIWAAAAMAEPGGQLRQDAYSDRIRDEMHPELRRAAGLSRLFFSPGFSSLFVTALRESGPIRQVFADLVAGTQPYRGLRRRLLWTREWKLAGRALQLVVQ